MANTVNISGSDFSELYNAVDLVAKRSAQATRFMQRMFNSDFSNAKIFSSLDALNAKLALTVANATAAKDVISAMGKNSPKMPPVQSVTSQGLNAQGTPSGANTGGSGGNSGGGKKTASGAGGSDPNNIPSPNAFVQAQSKKYQDKINSALEKQSSNYDRLKLRYKRLEMQDSDNAERQDALDLERAIKIYRKQQQDWIQKQVKAEEKRAKAVSDMSFVSSLKLMENLDKLIVREKKRRLEEEKAANRNSSNGRPNNRPSSARGRLGFFDQYVNSVKDLMEAQSIMRTFRSRSAKDVSRILSPNQWLSKFGNPGQMPLFTRFRVFQRPFPGSERNPFALGDASNVLNNAIYGSTRLLSDGFKTIVDAGADITKAFSSVAAAGFSVVGSLASMIPGIGSALSGITQALSNVLVGFGESISNTLGKLSESIGGVINSLGMLTLGLAGFLSRAVQASSTLTELRNAAMVYVGQQGGRQIERMSVDYQQQYGLSAADSLRLMTRVAGQYRQTTGASQEEAASQAQDIFKAAADAGSVLNMSLDDIGKTIQSALAGRYTPLRRIGVSVSAPYLDQLADAKGYAKDAKTPFEARIRALIDEIRRQTQPFLKDLEATQYEFANLQRKFLGQFEAVFVQVGRVVEPFARILLIAATTIGDSVINKIKAFADGLDQVFQDLQQGVGAAFDSDLYQYLLIFTKSISRAADYMYAIGLYFYNSRGMIAEGMQYMLKTVVKLSDALIHYSVTVISAAAQLVSSLGGVAPVIDIFKNSLISLANWVSFFTEKSPESKFRDAYDDMAKRRRITVEQLQAFQGKYPNEKATISNFKGQIGQYDAMMQEMLQATNSFRNPERIKENPELYRKYVKPTATESFLSPENTKAASVSLESFATDLKNSYKLFKDTVAGSELGIKVPQVFDGEQFLGKLLSQIGRAPSFADLEDLQDKGRSASRYFSPAAFYDEVATRELNAAETTAKNTTIMSDSIQAISANIAKLVEPTNTLNTLGIMALTTA